MSIELLPWIIHCQNPALVFRQHSARNTVNLQIKEELSTYNRTSSSFWSLDGCEGVTCIGQVLAGIMPSRLPHLQHGLCIQHNMAGPMDTYSSIGNTYRVYALFTLDCTQLIKIPGVMANRYH